MQPALFVDSGEHKEEKPKEVEPVISSYWKIAEPFPVDIKLQQFLTKLRIELDGIDPNRTLSKLQYDSMRKQTAKLILMIEQYTMKDYRKLILSAMTGLDIESQKQLNWFQHSIIIDALKGETDDGSMVLKQIQDDLIGHASCRASSLYNFLWSETDLPDL